MSSLFDQTLHIYVDIVSMIILEKKQMDEIRTLDTENYAYCEKCNSKIQNQEGKCDCLSGKKLYF